MAPLKDKLPKVAVPAIDKLQPVMLLDVSVPVKVKFVPVEEPEKLGATIGGNGIGTEVAYWRKT